MYIAIHHVHLWCIRNCYHVIIRNTLLPTCNTISPPISRVFNRKCNGSRLMLMLKTDGTDYNQDDCAQCSFNQLRILDLNGKISLLSVSPIAVTL